jgi:tetratricopeptide (TPR) repeat protein
MLTTISIILIILSCLVIFFIISKKFPALAVLDVDSLPEEKEAKFKERIMRQRLERDLSRFGSIFVKIWRLGQAIGNWLRRLYDRLREIKLGHVGRKMSFRDRQERISRLFFEADAAIADEEYQIAEGKLISILSFDDQDLRAFLKLADVYTRLKKLAEARQTYRYALKLMRQHKSDKEFLGGFLFQEIYFSLAWVEKDLGEIAAALDSVRDALEFEPNNPRYLDLILDLGIIKKDKKLCEESLARLAEANPENKKISEWQEKIDELPF